MSSFLFAPGGRREWELVIQEPASLQYSTWLQGTPLNVLGKAPWLLIFDQTKA